MAADAPLSADDLVTMRAFVDLSFTGDSLGRWRTLLALAEGSLAEARKPASDEEINAASWNALPPGQGLTWRQGFVAGAAWATREAAPAGRGDGEAKETP